jgi:AraC-like DNA-binding protein
LAIDVLSSVVDALRIKGQLFCRAQRHGPWGIVLPAVPAPYFHVIERGTCWLERDQTPPLPLAAGEVVLLPAGTAHRLVDAPGRPALPLQVISRTIFAEHRLVEEGDSIVLCGGFTIDARAIHPLTALLPEIVHVRPSGAEGVLLERTIASLAREAHDLRPGFDAIARRLTEVLFLAVLRAWLPGATQPPSGWLAALRDREISLALTALHADPAHEWTLAELAARCGLARSRFTERFTELVGVPPMTYLARWRMQLASDLLTRTDLRVGEVAASVGYASEAAFTRAFRAATQRTPAAWRRAEAS